MADDPLTKKRIRTMNSDLRLLHLMEFVQMRVDSAGVLSMTVELNWIARHVTRERWGNLQTCPRFQLGASSSNEKIFSRRRKQMLLVLDGNPHTSSE